MDNIELPEGGFMQATRDFETICKSYKWDINEILSPRRQELLVEKRKIIAGILRKKGYSFPKIGYAMNRDHSSIINLLNPKKEKKK